MNKNKLEDERILELESMLSHQNHTIEELNSVVIEQSRAINKIEKSIKTILLWIQNDKDSSSSGVPNPKPPHY